LTTHHYIRDEKSKNGCRENEGQVHVMVQAGSRGGRAGDGSQWAPHVLSISSCVWSKATKG